MRQDITAQLASYKGILGWEQFTEPYSGTVRKKLEVELYIKNMPLPQRKPKFQEINTVDQIDHRSGKDITTRVIFAGATDILQTQVDGFLLTPWTQTQTDRYWTPLAYDGSNLGFDRYNYGEIVTMYIEGDMNRNAGGAPQRKDPDYFITPHGQQYSSPVISQWDTQMTVNPRKQQFTMTIYLER